MVLLTSGLLFLTELAKMCRKEIILGTQLLCCAGETLAKRVQKSLGDTQSNV